MYNSIFKDLSFISSDGVGYYIYLPAVFIDKDIGLQTTVMHIAQSKGMDPYTDNDFFGISQKTDNLWINKYPVGMALIEAPFFFSADVLTQVSGRVRDGYSAIYQLAIAFAGFLYLQLGMYFTYRVLKKRFGHGLSLILLTFLLLGTNIIHYSVCEPSMSHIYSFTFITLMVFLLDKYIERKTFKWIIAMGITLSIIGLIRNINILVGIIPLIVIHLSTPKEKRLPLIIKTLLIWGITALIFFAPQFAYWQITTGNIISYSYPGETFNFLRPLLLKILFSVNNGLFFWHPLLLLSIPGAYYWMKSREYMSKVSIIFILALIYILSCWWAWWFGFSFGSRAFTDFYILFLIPIGYLFQRISKWHSQYKILTIVIVCLFFALNLIQMNNYWRGIVAGHNINWETYWSNFANPHLNNIFK
jgi:hypothetical protein